MADQPIYLPKQSVKPGRGVAGYKGKDVIVIDPATGKEDGVATKAAKSKKK